MRILVGINSAIICVHGGLNTKHDVICSHTIEEAGNILNHVAEKFSVGVIIFGARGLIPSNSPVFTDEIS